MKTLTLWTIILTLLVSCSTENETLVRDDNQTNFTDEAVFRKTGLYPENSTNIYDAAGQLYYAITEAYLLQGNISVTTAGTISQVENIANMNAEYLSLRPATYMSPTSERIDYILTDQQVTALDIIANSSMSSRAKLSLNSFITSLMTYRDLQKEYDYIYSFIIDYETATVADNALTANDKKIILTTSSLSRYGFYFASKHRRKPRDRDWDISWGHIVAGTDGSEANMAEAIVKSAVCGIIINK
ncbi:hypothetical protein [Flavobacterium caeni]|uniref:Uncharacterized protein n=1 Tax=Flavobacterium caeni TaxID=490189 RepID=A0A1G5K8W8_9FLAO|nr:hypothetical protein [Flavobacterium caeni]SCY96379.1 hypothetical protein SAMN02927903_03123 [Flavobacterium caeni]